MNRTAFVRWTAILTVIVSILAILAPDMQAAGQRMCAIAHYQRVVLRKWYGAIRMYHHG